MGRRTIECTATAKAKATKVMEGLRKQQSGMILITLILALVGIASACAFLAQCSVLLPVAAP
jgi:hypothetical protein